MSTPYGATALATTETAKLHRLTVVMIEVLLGMHVGVASTRRALIARGLMSDLGSLTADGVNVAAHMETELLTDMPEPVPAEPPHYGVESPEILDRSAAKAALVAKYKDAAQPPFPGAVAVTCTPCGAHIVWTNPPLPSEGETVCKSCSQEQEDDPGARSASHEGPVRGTDPRVTEESVTRLVTWRSPVTPRRTVLGSAIVPGMVVLTGALGPVTVGRIFRVGENAGCEGRTAEGRRVELHLPRNHRITLVCDGRPALFAVA